MKNIEEANLIINEWKAEGHKIYMTSGGFDPLHVGHVMCIQETAAMAERNNGKVVILVNGDQFLVKKKGKPFMRAAERCVIISYLKGVDLAVEWYDGSQTVSKAIRLFKPNYFTKGGDRSDPGTVPEWDACQEVDCRVVFEVGGGKVQSSSWLLQE